MHASSLLLYLFKGFKSWGINFVLILWRIRRLCTIKTSHMFHSLKLSSHFKQGIYLIKLQKKACFDNEGLVTSKVHVTASRTRHWPIVIHHHTVAPPTGVQSLNGWHLAIPDTSDMSKEKKTRYNHWHCLHGIQYTDAHSVPYIPLESTDNRTNGTVKETLQEQADAG